ncbi:MAG: transcription antitermination factor NusB [Pseudomonadota bacterium]|nr:transcription antitermination factor NusB [Pseudomonadota bacterium]
MSKKTKENNAKRLARLAAVQGLYRIELTQHPVKDVMRDFRQHPETFLQDTGQDATGADPELFEAILSGVTKNHETIDEMIAGALSAKVSSGRIEILLRAILRGGVFELHHHGQIPAKVIINDYVDVAHAFFSAKEPGLVNAVLDKLAKNLRAT